MGEKLEQARRQCGAIIHMAESLTRLYEGQVAILASLDGNQDARLPIETVEYISNALGHQSYRVMNSLGDILNGIDSVTEGEERVFGPVFERGREVFGGKTARGSTQSGGEDG